MTNPAIASVAIGVVPPEKAGMGSGINNTFRQVGIATGIAAFGAVFQHGIETRLVENGAPEELGEAVASSGTRAAEGGPSQLLETVQDAFIGSLNELFVIAGIVALVAAVLGLLLTRDGDISDAGEAAPGGG